MSSSPVARMATTGLRTVASMARPAVAASRMWRAVRRVPAASTASLHGSAAAPAHVGALAGEFQNANRIGGRCGRTPWMTMVSAPSGKQRP